MITQEDIDAFKDNDLTPEGEKIQTALKVALTYGGIDGAHHKDWIIDQMVRALTGETYDQWVKDACAGTDGPQTFTWEKGIAP